MTASSGQTYRRDYTGANRTPPLGEVESLSCAGQRVIKLTLAVRESAPEHGSSKNLTVEIPLLLRNHISFRPNGSDLLQPWATVHFYALGKVT